MYWFIFMDNYQHGPRTSKTPHPIHLEPIHLTTQMDLPLSIVIAINALSNAILVHFNNRNPVINKSLGVPLYFLWRIKPSRQTVQVMHRLPQKEVNHLYDRCGDLPWTALPFDTAISFFEGGTGRLSLRIVGSRSATGATPDSCM